MFSHLRTMFNRSLKQRPIITNVSVYATFYSAAEFSQQTYNKYFTPAHPDYNPYAAARIVTVGSCLYAPILYHWYRFLDSKLPGTAALTVAKKVCCDQLIMTPILLASFFTLMGILERKKDVLEELKAKYVKTFLMNQTFWIPGQTINFALVPSHLRVVYVASASFIWINILCYIKRQAIVPDKTDK